MWLTPAPASASMRSRGLYFAGSPGADPLSVKVAPMISRPMHSLVSSLHRRLLFYIQDAGPLERAKRSSRRAGRGGWMSGWGPFALDGRVALVSGGARGIGWGI